MMQNFFNLILGSAIPKIRCFFYKFSILAVTTHTVFMSVAAPKILAKDFLRGALSTQEQDLGYEQEGRSFPYFHNIELSIDAPLAEPNRDRFLKDQKFGLKFSPRGWGESSALRGLYNSGLVLEKLNRQIELNNDLRRRYHLMIDLHIHEKTQAILEGLVPLHERKVKVLRSYVKLGDADMEDILKSKLQLEKLKAELIVLQANSYRLRREAGALIDKSEAVEIELKNFISISKLTGKINKHFTQERNELYLEKSKHELAYQEHDLNRSIGEDRRWIGSIELETNVERDMRIKLSLPLPFAGFDAADLSQKKAKAFVEKRRAAQQIAQESAQLDIALGHLKAQATAYLSLDQALEDRRASASLKIGGKNRLSEPRLLLENSILLLEGELTLIALKKNALASYLEYLGATGALIQKPLSNQLSSQTEDLL